MPELPSPVWDLGYVSSQAAFAGGNGGEMAGPFVVLGEK